MGHGAPGRCIDRLPDPVASARAYGRREAGARSIKPRFEKRMVASNASGAAWVGSRFVKRPALERPRSFMRGSAHFDVHRSRAEFEIVVANAPLEHTQAHVFSSTLGG